jgi:hypothetical protein
LFGHLAIVNFFRAGELFELLKSKAHKADPV